MSNLATVQKIYEAFGTGDIPFILGQCAPDVAWEQWDDNHAQAAGVPWLLPRRGPDGAAEFFGEIGKFTFNGFEVQGLLDGGDHVAAIIGLDVTTATGHRLRDEEMHLWSFDSAGKVSRFRHYVDTAKHIEASRA